jgi:hypothetical protein
MPKHLSVIEPRLEIARRCLDKHRGLKTALFHLFDAAPRQIVHQAKVMLSVGPDVDIPPAAILKRKPGNRLNKRIHIPHAGEHVRLATLASLFKKADFITACAHRNCLKLCILQSPDHGFTAFLLISENQ